MAEYYFGHMKISMSNITFCVTPLLLLFISIVSAQDTFSIVAADSTSREVGSAGASCVDLFTAGITDASFLGDLLPDTGAINTQAFYLIANQTNARLRMRAGDTPAQIISWLASNDVNDNPGIRQYGIAGYTGASTSSAGYTGVNTNDYKNHITGSIDGISYSIQGNILLNAEILEFMEARFRNTQGDLACRLMAALQGAKSVGADTRCAGNGTSSLFAFIKVAQPKDAFGNPSLKINVRTHHGAAVEPIDSLQNVFDRVHSCDITGTGFEQPESKWYVIPNPATDEIYIESELPLAYHAYEIIDTRGKVVMKGEFNIRQSKVSIQSLLPGLYNINVHHLGLKKFIKV
jgi:uncharacterized Ntn-hydrolase superfamily protein